MILSVFLITQMIIGSEPPKEVLRQELNSMDFCERKAEEFNAEPPTIDLNNVHVVGRRLCETEQ